MQVLRQTAVTFSLSCSFYLDVQRRQAVRKSEPGRVQLSTIIDESPRILPYVPASLCGGVSLCVHNGVQLHAWKLFGLNRLAAFLAVDVICSAVELNKLCG